MKVLHLNEHLSWSGGVETYLLTLIPEIRHHDIDSRIVYSRGDAGLAESAIQLPDLSRGDTAAEKSAFEETNVILDETQPDLVHLHQVYNTGAVRACLGRAPVIVHAHDYRYVCPASTFYYKRARQECHRVSGPGCFAVTLGKHCLTPRPNFAFDYYRRVKWFKQHRDQFAGVIAPSEGARRRYLVAGFAPDKVQVLPYFSSVMAGESPRPMPNRPAILFVGRNRPSKGVDTFIEAFSQLPESVHAVMVGDFDAASSTAMTKRCEELGCAGRIQLRGWAERDEIRDVFSQATVFVFPSIWPETLGIVGIEALACGVPVVASDIGGVREWLKDGETGFLAEPGNAADFAAKIRRLLDDDALNLEFGRNGQRLVRERFTPETHVRQLLGIYRSAIDSHAAGMTGAAG